MRRSDIGNWMMGLAIGFAVQFVVLYMLAQLVMSHNWVALGLIAWVLIAAALMASDCDP